MNKRVVLLTLPFIFLLSIPAASEQEGRFERTSFELKGQVMDVITDDLDGDGLLDLVAIHVDESKAPPDRHITIFPHHPKNGFSENTKVEWEVPADVAAVDVGDVAPDPGKELVFIKEGGIYYARVTEGSIGRLELAFETQSVVAIAYDRGVPYYNFVRDYTGDGMDDILVCGFYDTVFAHRGDQGGFDLQTINLRPGMDLQAIDMQFMMVSQDHPLFRVTYYVPKVYSEDADGDGLLDLVANFREEVLVFRQTGDGFTREPVERFHVKLFEKRFTDRRRRRRNDFPSFEFEDINGDGIMDLVASQTQGEFGNMQSKTHLYLGGENGISGNEPDMSFKTEKASLGVYLQDVNKDNMIDIIMPTMDMSLWTTGKVLVTGDLQVDWAYFIQQPDRSFMDSPTRIVPTYLKFNMRRFKLESGVPNVFGDFNGDGYPDQALGEDKESLVITLRDGQGEPLEIQEKINIPVSMVSKAVDMDGDGLSDLVIHYHQRQDHAGEVHVFMNKGQWVNKG